jgi:hypothetical protein
MLSTVIAGLVLIAASAKEDGRTIIGVQIGDVRGATGMAMSRPRVAGYLRGPVERLLVIDETPFEPNAGIGRMRRVRASADVDLPVCPHLLRDQQRAMGADPASIRHNLPRRPFPAASGLNPRFVRSISRALVRRELPHPNANTPAPKKTGGASAPYSQDLRDRVVGSMARVAAVGQRQRCLG